MKKLRKGLIFILIIALVFATGANAFSATPIDESISEAEFSINVDLAELSLLELPTEDEINDFIDNLPAPNWAGPAPQVTHVSFFDFDWLPNGNFGVLVFVVGYGNDFTLFNGNRIRFPSIVASGPGGGWPAEWFLYLFDCGPILSPGVYPFSTLWTSINWPFTELGFSTNFIFSQNPTHSPPRL